MKPTIRVSAFYWKIAVIFMVAILILAVIFLWVSIRSSIGYFQEAHQRLNSEVAEHIALETEPFVNGSINSSALEDLFHDVMVLHPSLEIYLLDNTGQILAYSAPDSLIQLQSVEIDPIETFIEKQGEVFVKGSDPRHPDQKKIFSAAPVIRSGIHHGYVYAVLRGDQYTSTNDALFESYGFRLATKVIVIAIIASLVIGLLAFRIITGNLEHVIRQIRAYRLLPDKSGYRMEASGELKPLAITFNRMAQEIEENINAIKKMEKSRRELIANVSHDLRTPLSTIRGYAETLLVMDKSLSGKDRKKYTRVILNNAKRLKKQADELFELSRLESGEIQIQCEPFSISELVQDNIQKYKDKAHEKGINLKSEIPDEIPLAFADIGLIDRVLQNLIDNALKFTAGKGVVTIELCHRIRPGNICVMVRDTGIGIPDTLIDSVFNRYIKSNRNFTEESGSGLGLAIVKNILELHNTEIFVESIVDEGTTFYFDLPVYNS
ncbi:sensor histidine kinase [Membranihabitans maritimus]|uniref:sensor histidine kinase n=1 Tax=Membranihabitans maritimus TaxID=2904244 RepID=UPI001F2F8D06|nr:HAMP domain-containing sensor histidine kinase [Membranihabitans maritimus]